MLHKFTSLDNPDIPDSTVNLEDELASKLVFEDPRVFKRLALDRVSSQFVDNCTEALQTDQRLLNARRKLQNITTAAISQPIDELEAYDDSDSDFDDAWEFFRIRVKKKVQEKKMYKHLTSIFRHVENFQDSSGTSPKHSFECIDSTVLKSDSSTWGFPKGSPDFGMVERLSPTPGQRHILWRQIGGFCEIKPTSQQGPKSADPKLVTPLVCQAAYFARLHLSARPFQLFSVGLLIFGSQFCVAIFDRAGVSFSPIHDMWEDTGIFIRVIRSLTCHLTSVELGQDPTVTILSDQQDKIWKKETRELGRETPEDFPTFVVLVGNRRWYTVGIPIWISVSLLGRGTSVWLVQENGKGPLLVLKNTWKSGPWIPESKIYESIKGHHPALAKLHLGEDVLFPCEKRNITVLNLRGSSANDEIEGGDISLHRLLLEHPGRPLWEYRTEKELLQAIRAALSAHEFLCKQDILHRDITPGNILLPMQTPREVGAEGFLMDLEYARLKRSVDIAKTINVPPIRRPGGGMTAPTVRTHTTFGSGVMRAGGPDVMCCAAWMGTAQFMAAEILEAIATQTPVEHEPKHDIESFIYVLAYSVARRALLKSLDLDEETRKNLHSFFYSTFGQTQLDDILNCREGPVPLKIRHRFPTVISVPMAELMHDLDGWLTQSRLPAGWNPKPLTHTYMLSALDNAITRMI